MRHGEERRGRERDIGVKCFQTEGSVNAKDLSGCMPGYSKTMREASVASKIRDDTRSITRSQR